MTDVQQMLARKASAKWDTIQYWKQALNHFQTLWPERIAAAQNR